VETIRNYWLLLPPVEEQHAISAHIDRAVQPIEAARMRQERAIALIREYRTCLIADVVTGKLDVRAVELPALEDGGEALDEPEDIDDEIEEAAEEYAEADADD
jgi:hypothetical protein